MESRKIVIFLSSVRPGRMADRVSTFVKQTVSAHGMTPVMLGMRAFTQDPNETQFELIKVPLHYMSNPDEAPVWMKEAHEKILTADGFIIISTQYNANIPPALSNMLDHFPVSSYRHRPCGLVSYSQGGFGGCRVLLILRTYATELGMLVTPTNVPIPKVQDIFLPDGTPTESSDRVTQNINHMVEQLGWYVNAFKAHKEKCPLPS